MAAQAGEPVHGRSHGTAQSGSGSRDAPAGVRVETLEDEPAVEHLRQVPLQIAHFVILRKLGEGAMGIVYAAYDSRLDRRVALKLVRRDLPDPQQNHDRVLREAQGLARLSHPNVVQVYEVGEVAGQLFLAMEYIDGQTLREWLHERPRGWSEVLEPFIAAGRGLAAAHAAQLVHHDFKPDNVLVGRDGRVRVMDFGLVRAVDHAVDEAIAEAPSDTRDATLWRKVAGKLIGTPAYMAPEQHLRAQTDARADQFAFCVALFEALHGRRPFAGDDTHTLAANVTAGNIVEPLRRGVPRWLRRIVLRGLSVDAARRWPSMDALLAAIERGQQGARLRLAGVALALGAALGGAAWTWHRFDEARRTSACMAAGASIDDVWNDAARARVREAMLATATPYAATAVDKTLPWLERQAAAWRTARSEACLDADVRESIDAETYARTSWCLAERRIALESLVHELSLADAPSVQRAVNAAAGLESVEPCRDPRMLARLPAPPPGAREEVQTILRVSWRASNLTASGRYNEGLAIARYAESRAAALGWLPLVAHARLRTSRLLERSGKYAEAIEGILNTYFTAAEAGALGVLADAATMMVHLENQRARPDDAQTWSRLAALALRELEPEEGLRTSHLYNNLAISRLEAGAFAEAQELNRRSLTIRERLLGEEHPDIAIGLNNLAISYYSTGNFVEVRALFERSVTLTERTLGAEHPQFASVLYNLASVQFMLGDPIAARASYERTLAVHERALGPDHIGLVDSLNALGEVHQALGAYAEARPLHERALAINERSFGAEHPGTAQSLAGLADLHAAAGEFTAARSLYERSIAVYEKVRGPDHPDVAERLRRLADLLARAGQYDEGRRIVERALAILERSKGAEHPDLAASFACLGTLELSAGRLSAARAALTRAQTLLERSFGDVHVGLVKPLTGLAELALAEQRPADALALATRAVALGARGVNPAQLAAARFALARALWATSDLRDDRARALELAAEARDGYGNSPMDAPRRAEVEQWLAQRRDDPESSE